MSRGADTSKVDESLYSRQLYVYGADGMKEMVKSNILIVGVTGVSVELAKCIILSGMNSVTIQSTYKMYDIGFIESNYFLTEKDIGKNLAVAVVEKLAELNGNVIVKSHTKELTKEFCTDYDVVVFCSGYDKKKYVEYNKYCRDANIKFIIAESDGLYGYVFSDFGESFTVNNLNGENPKTGVLVAIENKDGKDVYVSETFHDIDNGYLLEIYIDGKKEVGRVIHRVDANRFTIDLPQKGAQSLVNANFNEIKEKVTLNFKDYETSCNEPEFIFSDLCNFDRPQMLHDFNMAISDADNSKHELKKFQDKYNTKEAKLLLSLTDSAIDLTPISAVIGSIGAQEVIKAVSKKFTPIKQWFYFDALNIIPDGYVLPMFKPIKTRYDSQNELFGEDIQKKLKESTIFVVGSGAIGCEHLKNFAMMGIGNIIVTDMDIIEKSNLSRQFLFRNSDIGKFKSETAMEAIKKINPDVKVTAHRNKVGVETLDTYDEKFFKNLLCVANALDNVQARLFVDQLCVAHGVPLLESGTLGTKGNVQSIIPHLTESYGSTVDPPEQSVPVCTLKNFPYQIEHTIQYSRDMFEGYFNKAPTNYNKYLEDKTCVDKMTPSELLEFQKDIENVLNNLGKPFKYKHCVQYAFNVWHEIYRDNIEALIKKFPLDHKNDDGTPFWSGSKRCPKPSEFDIKNETHVGFIHAFANLWAKVGGLDPKYCTLERTINKIKKLEIPLRPLDLVFGEEKKDEKDKTNDSVDKDEVVKKLESLKLRNMVLTPQNFEKDDDTNFHIEFVTHASNMRAENYSIPFADKFKTKGIAGKIIPALATTTSLVSGLVALEVYKLILGFDEIEKYRNSYINFGTSFFGFTEPSPVKATKAGKLKYTMWDNFKFDNIKVAELIDYFEKNEVEVSSISSGNYMLISPMLSAKKLSERKQMDIVSLYKLVSGQDAVSPLRIAVMIDEVKDEDDDDDENDFDPILCKIEF